jgi:hypothetical protein
MDAGRRPGIIPAITLGMIPGIGMTLGTMAITATTAVGIHLGITAATIAHTAIGDGTVHATMPEATTVRTATISDLFAAILLQDTDPIAMVVVQLTVVVPLAMALR